MKNSSKVKSLLIVLLLAGFLAACRREEPTPSPQTLDSVTPASAGEVGTPEGTETPETSSEETVPEVVGPPAYDWQPQLVSASPSPGEELAVDGIVFIRFDQPMDTASVESAFTISDAEGGAAVAGDFTWPREDQLVFTPKNGLGRQQRYRLEIDETASGKNGLPLREAINYQIETVGFLEVTQVIPEPNSREIGTDSVITVMFNRPVVPLVSTGQQAELPQPLTFDPETEGTGEWTSTSVYRFFPDQPLAGGAQYRVTVNAGLESVTGGLLDDDFSWDFSTVRPSVESITPPDGTDGVDPTKPMTITFNMPMDRAVTASAVSLSPPAQVTFDWSDGDRVLTMAPADRLALQTDYVLTVAGTARSASGQATLDRPTSSAFSTVPFPSIIRTIPADNTLADRYQRGVNIRFASPMDISTLEDRVLISPEPDDPRYFYNDFDNSLSINFDYERNSEYMVTVPGDVTDPFGNALGEDYTWQFRTPGYDPLVSLNLPSSVSQLSTSYPTEVEIIHRNVSRIDAGLYDAGFNVEEMIAPYRFDSLPLGESLRSWSIPVENVPDAAEVYTLPLADGGVLPTGVYVLDVSAPEIAEQRSYWQNQRNLIIVADTNLVVKETFDHVYVWATDLETGQPAAGRTLNLYNHEGTWLGETMTDGNGLALFDNQPAEDYLRGVLVRSNEPGEDGFGVGSSVWNEGVRPWQFGLSTTTSQESEHFAYLYTDRPIYRPGDTVHFRGIVRRTDYGRYPLTDRESVTLKLDFFTNYEPVDFEFETTVDENGEFDGEYLIPEDASIGDYRLYFDDPDISTDRTFTVAQYRRPDFQVSVTPERDEALRGESVEVEVEASYFFGGSAADLKVNWSITERPYYPDWDGLRYSFGDDGSLYYSPSGPFNFGGFSGNHLLDGHGQTDENGRLVIDVPADLLDEVEPGSREITVEAVVSDVSNFPIAARAPMVFHAAETYSGVVVPNYLGTAGTPTEVDLITVDWSGKAVPGQEVELILYLREWIPVRDSEFNQYYTRWEAEDTEIERLTTTTDGQGKAQAEIVPPEGGSYVVAATVTDNGGRHHTSSTNLWVLDSNYAGWPGDPREKSMDLVTDRQEYKVGDIARILVQSPFEGPVRAWLTIERGDLIDQGVITLNSTSEVVEVPITSDFAPNVFVSIHAVKGIDEADPFADIRIGMSELIVSPERLALSLSLTPQEAFMEPGQNAIYDVLVTDYQGNPVQANFSVALVDLAVLTLKPDNAPHIVDAFYARQPMRSQTGAGLIISGEGLEVEIPLEALGLGGGGGEVEAAPSVALEGEDDDVRRDFPDTAYWEAQISTDENGRATIEIPLPDSVTTWRLSSKAVSDFTATGETLVGQDQVDVVATLPLLIQPITPRFFTAGDSLQLGAIVHNNTDEPLDAVVSLDATGLTFQGDIEQKLTIPSGSNILVRWPVTVNDEPFVDLTFRASAGEYRDATKPAFGIPPNQLIPVARYSGEDIVGTSGVLEDEGRTVEAILLPEGVDDRQGEVLIQLDPSLAASLLEALDYVNNLETRPACAHAVTDQILPNVATMLAVDKLDLGQTNLQGQLDSLIRGDLSRLKELQKGNGGWGWCYTERSDPFLSAYVLLGLAKAQQAGYAVENNVLSRGLRYLNSLLTDANDLNERSEINRQAFFLYVLAEHGEVEQGFLDDLFGEHRTLLDPYAKALLILAYELSGGSSNQQSLLADLNNSAIVSATGTHWEDEEQDWDNLSSDIRGTAMIIDAFALADPGNVLGPGAVRWLMSARQAEHWATGQQNAWSIIALTDWMATTSELDANYQYDVYINGMELDSGRFDQTNVTDNKKTGVPVEELILDDLNYLDFRRGEGNGRLYYTAHLDSFIRVDQLEAVDRGLTVQRVYYDASCDQTVETCLPIDEIVAGQQIRVELTVIAPDDQVYLVVEDRLPSGGEAIDPGLETSASGLGGNIAFSEEENICCYWGWWYFNRIEYRDDRVLFLSDFLPAGTYKFTYHIQTTIPGQYQVVPATARQEFFPEVFGRSEGFLFIITEQ